MVTEQAAPRAATGYRPELDDAGVEVEPVEPPGAGDGTLSGRALSTALGVLSLAVFMSSLDLFIVNLAFPSIRAESPGTSTAALSWVLNAYTVVFAAVMIPAGRYADRLGRRRLFAIGLAVFTAGSAACALAPGVGLLVAARVLQAAGAGLMVPTSLSLLLAVVPPAGRARAIGTWAAIGGMAAAFGPVVGGLLVQVDWRLVFWVNVPFGVAAVLLAVRVLPESRDEDPGPPPDVLGAVLLASSVGLLALGVVQGPDWGWASTGTTGSLLLGLALALLLVRRSRHHPAPVLAPALLRSPALRGASLASLAYYLGFSAYLLNTVQFLTDVWDYSAVRAGLAIAPGPLMVLLFARAVAPRLAPRLGGPARVAAVGCLLGVGSQLLFWVLLQPEPAYATTLLPAQLLGGAGVGLVIPSLIGAGTATLAPGELGAGSGVLNTARQVGVALGVAALVAVLTGTGGAPVDLTRAGAVLTAAAFGVAGVLALLTGRAVRLVAADSRRPRPGV